jgi:hypothetical protein
MAHYPTRKPPDEAALQRNEKKEKRKQLLEEIRKKRAKVLKNFTNGRIQPDLLGCIFRVCASLEPVS